MKIAMISFTVTGFALSGRIEAILAAAGHTAVRYKKSRYLESGAGIYVAEPLPQWTKKMFIEQDAIIFIGASGIAVRAIAPHVQDKTNDPAILILDEQGSFCIPLLAGHLGGANQLARQLCEKLGSTPVITTATDVNCRFAVDVFAAKNDLHIASMQLAKAVSASLLHQEAVGFVSELPVSGKLPAGLVEGAGGCDLGICISSHKQPPPFKQTLWLVPQNITLGIGCRKGAAKADIEFLVQEACRELGIFHEAIYQLASIDLKCEEPGIREYCEQYRLPFVTYSAAELNAVPGTYTGSDFVTAVTGVDNVCERSAVKAGNGGEIIQKKIAKNGVTAAFARENRSVEFE